MAREDTTVHLPSFVIKFQPTSVFFQVLNGKLILIIIYHI